MQFKLGKHMTPADMFRQEGERAARKSQRRNVERELKHFGKDADKQRKKLAYPPKGYSKDSAKEDAEFGEGRGGTPPAGHHSQAYWKKWASGEHKADTAAKNEYSQGENAIERKIPSETTPGKEYRVWGEKGNMHCSCPSFTYRNTCKHVQSLGEEGPKRKLKYGRNFYYGKGEGRGADNAWGQDEEQAKRVRKHLREQKRAKYIHKLVKNAPEGSALRPWNYERGRYE